MATVTKSTTLDALRSRYPAIVFGVGLCTSLLVVFVGWRAQNFVANSPDPYSFQAMARSLLHGEGFAPYGTVLNRRGPLYPALIALVYLVFGERPLIMQLVQALMLASVCALAFDIGRRLYNPRTGLIAGLLCAFHPGLLRYVADFHLETFLTFLCTVALWRSVFFLARPGVKNGVLFGASAALAALAKPVVLLYPVAFVAWYVLRHRESGLRRPTKAARGSVDLSRWLRQRSVALAAIFVTMGVLILPWTYRNYRASGHVVLITTGVGDAFLRGYIFSKPEYALLRLPPYSYAENESNATFQSLCEQAGTVWQRNDVESDRILTGASKQKLLASPAAFVRKFLVQLFTFWYEMTSLATSLVAGLTALFLWILALIGWRRARAEGYLSWPLFLPIFCLNISLAILLALGRYSVPIVPALAVLAAFGVDTLLVRRDHAHE
jgi:4-amino-4-deoxy-L-arabinose transferase-like glycosyltransferase